MNFTKSLVIIAVLGLVGGIAFSYSGLFDVSATVTDSAPVKWLLENTRKSSIARRAEDVQIRQLAELDQLGGAAKAYVEMCAGCHAAPGVNAFLGARDMNPPPPELSELSDQRSPEEIFWVIKNGIRMTGMPAWGRTHSDREIWELVSVIKAMPDLTDTQFIVLASSVEDDGHDHDHGSGGEHMMSHDAPAASQPGLLDSEENHEDHSHASDNEIVNSDAAPKEIETQSESYNRAPVDDHYSDGHTH